MSDTTQTKTDAQPVDCKALLADLAEIYRSVQSVRGKLCQLASDPHVNPATLHAAAYLEEHTRRFEAALGRAAIPLAMAAHQPEGTP